MNVYRKFYFPKTQGTFTKPRFLLKQGTLELRPNPVQTIGERDRLADPDFVANLGAADFWFNHRHLPFLRFPYVRVLFDRFFWRQLMPQGRINPSDIDAAPDFVLWDDAQARDLTVAIIDRFITEAIRHGDTPILLHLPVKGEILARRQSGQVPPAVAILEPICAAHGWNCLFPVLDAERLFTDVDALFTPGGHYSAAGNERVALFLASWWASR